MNNYKESQISGTEYVRAYKGEINNPLDGIKSIFFAEEKVRIFGNEVIKTDCGYVQADLTIDTAFTEFPLLDLTTKEVSNTTMTFLEASNVLESLYRYLAEVRDNSTI